MTRRAGESLLIGDEVSVTVLSVKGGQVRIGVDAPRDIAVHREEVISQSAVRALEDESQAVPTPKTKQPSKE